MSIRERLEIYFEMVDDKRKKANVTYRLTDVLFLLVCGTICGCTDIEMILEFAEERESFFKKHTEFKTFPTVKTVQNILRIVKPEELEICLYGIIRNVFKQDIKPKEKQICIDGKTICSTTKMKKYKRPVHIITALMADNSMTLGQIVVEDKSNEIPAVRELIELIDVKDAIVTMDAMHCQKETIEKVIKNKGDYVVQLKANQGNFYEDVYAMFDDKYMDEADKNCEYESYQTIEKSHGRIEKRTCYVLNEIEFFTNYVREWKGLKKIFAVKREIEVGGKKTKEISCYLSSKNTSAQKLLSYTRKHWQIESFHWMLDVNFDEDDTKVRDKNSLICLNIMKKFAISIIKEYIANNEVKRKTIIANMRKCMFNETYLTQVLEYYCNSSL